MEETSQVPLSWVESTPEKQGISKNEKLLQLSDMLKRNRIMFEQCLPLENSKMLAAISDMLIQAPEQVNDVDEIIAGISFLVNQPEAGDNRKDGVVRNDLQGGSDVGWTEGGKPGGGLSKEIVDNGGIRATLPTGLMGEEDEARHVCDGGLHGSTPKSRALLEQRNNRGPTDVNVDHRSCLFAAHQNNEAIGNPNPKRQITTVPLDTQHNHQNATTFPIPSVPLHPSCINQTATTGYNPLHEVIPERNPDLKITGVPLMNTQNHHNATPVIIPSVPLHTSSNNHIATPYFNPPLHAKDQDTTSAGLKPLHVSENFFEANLGDDTRDDGGIIGHSNRGTSYEGNKHLQGDKKGEERKTLLGDLKKHLTKGGTTGKGLLQRFQACEPKNNEGTEVGRDCTSSKHEIYEGKLNTEIREESVVSQVGGPSSPKLNYAQVLTNSETTDDKVSYTPAGPAKPIEIPYFPDNLNKKKVRIDSETLKKGANQWINCIVGKFIVRRPPSSLIRSRTMALWQRRGLISIMEQQDEFIFKFETEDQRNQILETRVWTIAGQQMIISGWLEENAYVTSHFTKFPIWVKLLKVPPICWTREGIGQIASTIGKPLVIDAITASRQYMNYVRVKIEVEAGVERPRVVEVELADNVFREVVVHYTGCPPSCMECKSFGHYTSKCPKNSRENETEEVVENKISDHEDVEVEGKVEEVKDDEEISKRKKDTARGNIQGVRREEEDQAEAEATIGGQQQMEQSGESTSLDTDAHAQDKSEETHPGPQNHVTPNIRGLSKSQKKKQKKAKQGEGRGVNGRSQDSGDTRPD